MISGGGGGIIGGAGNGLGFGGRIGGNRPSRQRMSNHLLYSLAQQRLKKEWNYEGEEADFNFWRKTDKETPDAEMKEKLELLHKWYPNESFQEMQEKTNRVKNKFLLWFPKADMKKISVLEHPDTGVNIFFGAWAIFGDQPKDEDKLSNPEVLKALGIGSLTFPPKLIQNTRGRYSLPKSGISGGCESLVKLRLWSSEKNSFVIDFRDIFQKQVVSFKSASACETWKRSQNFKFWPQQLNLALWCATGGCGVSMNFSGLPKIVEGLLRFHIYFTTRRLLWEMKAALPGDSGFVVDNNPFSAPDVERVKNEFGIGDEMDFRWFHGSNGGLGNVFSFGNVMGKNALVKMGNDEMHARYNKWPGGISKFSDEDAHHTKVKKDGFFGMFKDNAGGEEPNDIASETMKAGSRTTGFPWKILGG